MPNALIYVALFYRQEWIYTGRLLWHIAILTLVHGGVGTYSLSTIGLFPNTILPLNLITSDVLM